MIEGEEAMCGVTVPALGLALDPIIVLCAA